MSSTMKTINTNRLKHLALYSGIATALTVTPMMASAGDVDVSIGGYAKLSAIYSDTDSGAIAGDSAGRTFYVASTTPVAAAPLANSHKTLDLTARESRINFKANTEQDGHKLGMTMELDFLTTTEGNEVVSNSSAPRLRHAFFTYDNYLFGQAWSTFMDVGALPASVDFLGASEGTVFIRQAQVRYTSGDMQIALENPQSAISNATTAAALDGDVGIIPDIAANYKIKTDGGYIRVNGLLRQLAVDQTGFDETASGYGLGISGKISVGSSDNIKFAINSGDGMGRYTSVGLVKDGVLIGGKIETVKSTTGFAAYQHAWSDKSSSSLILSSASIDNPAGAAGTENKSATSVQINYMYSPVKKVTFGVMFMQATRETENGDEGELNRLQASAKYDF
ncbi:MAG: DcaP family trimeric outer membrane transporter [Gammaproteobacteria bacterium]|nr:DcaP family trimeric outer membrane transporter [Gammaproteobacteria bacterium]